MPKHIYRYARDRWGTEQADRHITGLFTAFEKIEARGVTSKPIPAEFGVAGFLFRYEQPKIGPWREDLDRLPAVNAARASRSD